MGTQTSTKALPGSMITFPGRILRGQEQWVASRDGQEVVGP